MVVTNVEKEGFAFIVGLIISSIIWTVVFFGAVIISENKFRAEAVKNGVAEWKADENGNAVFRWKVNTHKE